jgi:hypothetical protein
MKKNYVLQSLESLLHEITQHPFQEKTDDQTAQLIQSIANEKVKVYNYLKAEIINLKQEEHTRLMVQKYHHAIVLLINQTFNLQKRSMDLDINSKEIVAYLLVSLEEMQQFLELSYPAFLSPQKFMGLPELTALKLEIEKKLPDLPPILEIGKNSEMSITIVLNAFKQFTDRIEKQEAITIEQYDYHRQLLDDLLTRGHEPIMLQDCPTLHELLLYWNFNSTDSIKYFRKGLEELIQQNETEKEKLDFMHYQFKRLLLIPVMQKKIYDKNFPSIKSFFLGWLKNEIDYLEQKSEGIRPLVEGYNSTREKVSPVKVQVDLSADQISLILRGMRDTNILISKSMDSVFQLIIPHLSTKQRADLSPKSAQKKAYAGEDRDKQVVVSTLNGLIETVSGY